MMVIFPSEPFAPSEPDSFYQGEHMAAASFGFRTGLLNFESLLAGDLSGALRRLPAAATPTPALYRGWMLRPEEYARLHGGLRERGIELLNSLDQYRHCHYLPESYPIIAPHTPATVSVPVDGGFSMERVMELLAPFGERPLIVKDYVKSRKHEWEDACYIPSAADRSAVERVAGNFLRLQGDDLNEGLVFREFVEFRPLGRHTRSSMPLVMEYRRFYLDGEPLLTAEYWEEGEYAGELPPADLFADVARNVRSRFFTMDVAQRTDGRWMIVELGDAQVAGLPDVVNPATFYERLAERFASWTRSV